MIFVISTNNVRMFALIDSDFNQNFIDQRLAYEWRLSRAAKKAHIDSTYMFYSVTCKHELWIFEIKLLSIYT
jgi:hypothetical protein